MEPEAGEGRAGLVVCQECGHTAQDEERHRQHRSEARHVHTYRQMAYRYRLNSL